MVIILLLGLLFIMTIIAFVFKLILSLLAVTVPAFGLLMIVALLMEILFSILVGK